MKAGLRYLVKILLVLPMMAAYANPLDVFETDVNKNKVFYCEENAYNAFINKNLTPIKTGPGRIDYCDKLRLNVKHYNNADAALSNTCPSKSVFRVISQAGAPGADRFCEVKEIKWYCDPVDAKIFPDVNKLPKNSSYCPEELRDSSLEILRCPENKVVASNAKLLASRADISKTYCNIVEIGERHYLGKDQKYARYSANDISQLVQMGDMDAKSISVCKSNSAYRVITQKSPVDINGNCRVIYDVYCDTEKFDKIPFDHKLCPAPSKIIVKQDNQCGGGGCCGSCCGGCCNSGGCNASNSMGSAMDRGAADWPGRIIERNGIRYQFDFYTGYYLPIE